MSKQELLVRLGVPAQTLELWLEQQWLIPAQTTLGLTFSDIDIARAHFIRDLQSDFGVNDEAMDLVLHLVDQLNGLRYALSELRKDVR
ncbi:MAG: MerR family transcriptional regulator [Proteobacteria bacterium]|nr:MerR family transcriptional regulator [Pseudomonadota bacterium]